MDKTEALYASSSDMFLAEYKKVDLSILSSGKSLTDLKSSLANSRAILLGQYQDVGQTVSRLKVSSEVQSLSPEDQKAKDLFNVCYSGRDTGIKKVMDAIAGEIIFVDGIEYLDKYQAEKNHFQQMNLDFSAARASGSDGKITSAMSDITKSANIMKSNLESAYQILGLPSLKIAAEGYQNMANGFNHFELAYTSKDKVLADKAGIEVKNGANSIRTIENNLILESDEWFSKNVDTLVKEGNSDLDAVQDSCYAASSAVRAKDWKKVVGI